MQQRPSLRSWRSLRERQSLKSEARKVQPWREVLDGHVPGIFAMKPASEALQGYGQTKEVVIKRITRWEEDHPESLGRCVESPTRTLNFEAWSTAENNHLTSR